MTVANWPTGCSFVWQPGYDDPDDGYHVTPGDAGGGTVGGVIEATWASAVSKGIVNGTLANASREQLALVLQNEFWGSACDSLASGLDLMLFNGRMMSGGYSKLFQAAIGVSQDGYIGPKTIAAANAIPVKVLAERLTVAHIYYLSQLGPAWTEFHNGWEGRVLQAFVAALGLAVIPPPAA